MKVTDYYLMKDSGDTLVRRFNIASSLVPIGENLSVLDIGCADGSFLRYPCFRQFVRLGLDIDESKVRVAKSNDVDGLYFVADAQRIPLPENLVNVIICQEVIEHLAEEQLFLNECHRLLKKRGYLILSTPNRTNSRYYFGLKTGLVDKDHLREYTLKEIVRTLLQYKFDIIKIRGTYLPLLIEGLLAKFFIVRFIQYILGSLMLNLTYVFVIRARVKK